MTLCVLLAGVTLLLLSKPSLVQRLRHCFYFRPESSLSLEKETPPSPAARASGVQAVQTTAPESPYDTYKLSDVLQGKTALILSQSGMLVNQEHPLPEDFKPWLENFPNSEVPAQKEMIQPYTNLVNAVQNNFQEQLYISSLYRSQKQQEDIYLTMPEVAQVPGSSEHQTGLAVDVYVFEFAGANFINAPAGLWVNENCWRYGFIIRYPLGREDITKITYEPWHLRYVGLPHSQIMHEKGWVLEEYIAALSLDDIYDWGDYFVTRQKGPELRIPKGAAEVKISPDNTGAYLIWGKSGKTTAPLEQLK